MGGNIFSEILVALRASFCKGAIAEERVIARVWKERYEACEKDFKQYKKEAISQIRMLKENLRTALELGSGSPDLPGVFKLASSVYKSGFRTYNYSKGGINGVWYSPKHAGGHLTLTPAFEKAIKEANIKENDASLTVFNKLLAWTQKNLKYKFDHEQWGKNQGENWTPAIMVLATREDDCESLSAVVIACFIYYQLTRRKCLDAYAFIGTGLYNKSYGHGFPCLYVPGNGKLDDELFIGEATLTVARAAKPLSHAKKLYWCNWGCHSFWHEFKIKDYLIWWKETAARPLRKNDMQTGARVSTRNKRKPFMVRTKEEAERKQKAIEDFWSEKRND